MLTTVEISLYPLEENYGPIIKDFITRLKKYPDIEVVVNAMSTQIVGEHAQIFEILSKETDTTFSNGNAVFVIKILGFARDLKKNYA